VIAIQDEWAGRFGRREPKIICVGLNYYNHAAEQHVEVPDEPLLFAKTANTLCGHGDPIILPPQDGHVDAEAELAVVIGRTARNVSLEEAPEVIAGYTCANDVSARDVQFKDGQWFRGKSFDTFCPIGPNLVASGEIGDARDLRIVQRVNGEVLQDSRTSLLIFGVSALVAFASEVLTLEPGDLILTGTPAGVGYFRDPKHSLRSGDEVEIEIEKIGVLRNPVVGGAV
jgi:2-keto-4-pentenoate hydratase/2-oxohepta-3-ene-1,7-dioic acid hydratase in catechol pathway